MGVKLKEQAGQMTVEFVVAFPVMLVVALIATNALLLFSECASFDRIAREAIRIHVSSPAYGQTHEEACAAAGREIASHFDKDYVDTQLTYAQEGLGRLRLTATLNFSPTLFGMGLRSEILGVALPTPTHSFTCVIDPYKPGVLL